LEVAALVLWQTGRSSCGMGQAQLQRLEQLQQ
jgi:hypothetical protein